MSEQRLPIHDVLDEILTSLERQHELVIEAPPGAGKTTIVPLALLGAGWLAGRRILVLEPRRLAARAAAHRMAELINEPVGMTVGYRMRLDTKVSASTRIEVVTEGVLTRVLLSDPSLADVGVILFDEFHERSLDADVGLALTRQARSLFRDVDPLRIVVMSATLDSERLQTHLDAPVIRSEGRRFPVETIFLGGGSRRDAIVDRVVAATVRALEKHPESSALVFLPGQSEINRVGSALRARVGPDVTVHPLYGNLSLEEQQAAIRPSGPGKRKAVLATNIAETSLTIDGVDIVVDSGLVRESVFDPATGMSRLATRNVSQASATQREGRAGRLRPGRCYRLWSHDRQDQLARHTDPEILKADLAPLALTLFDWGINDPGELEWLDAPPRGAWAQALELLTRLGALTDYTLTPHGRDLARVSAHPRVAQLLVTGDRLDARDTATAIAAYTSERDPMSGGADVRDRLEVIAGTAVPQDRHGGWARRMRTLAAQFARELPGRRDTGARDVAAADMPGLLLATAWPDRVARRRHSGGYQLANGRSAVLPERDRLGRSQWLAVAEVSGGDRRRHDTIRAAAPLNPELFDSHLAHLVSETSDAAWNKKAGRFEAETRREIGRLVLERAPLTKVPEGAREAALIGYIRDEGLRAVGWSDEHANWCARVELARASEREGFPDCSDAGLLDSLEDWLLPYLANVTHMNHLRKLKLGDILRARLDWQQQQRLDTLAPERLAVPSGSHVRIDYAQSPPVLAVKLQELFGVETTPTVGGGAVPVLIHLLSPAGRPLQITQDLAHFWRNGYAEVRKEMQGRYPKHPWPEDPLSAEPTRHTNRRK